jgi:DNA-binding MarR family transcriptional regulator
MVAEPDWLTETEQQAWQGMLVIALLAFPEMERTFKSYGLVQIEYGVLARLSDHPGGMRLCDLAEQLNVSQSRLSHRMNKLRERGLVEVRGSSDDGRVSMAYLTARGRDLIDEIAPRHVKDVRRLIFDHLSDTQVDALADGLGTIRDALVPGECPTGI